MITEQNFNEQLNLMQLIGATACSMNGQEGVFIPYQPNFINKGTKGVGAYLSLRAFKLKDARQNNSFLTTHCVKVAIPKDIFDQMNDEQKAAYKPIGDISSYTGGGVPVSQMPQQPPVAGYPPQGYAYPQGYVPQQGYAPQPAAAQYPQGGYAPQPQGYPAQPMAPAPQAPAQSQYPQPPAMPATPPVAQMPADPNGDLPF